MCSVSWVVGCCWVIFLGFWVIPFVPQVWAYTLEKINMEPKKHPIEKENHLPSLQFWVPWWAESCDAWGRWSWAMPVQPKCAGTSCQIGSNWPTEGSARFMQSTPCTICITVHATRCIQMIKRWVKCWFNEAEGNSFIISSLCKVLPWTRATIAAWTFEVGCDGADSVWSLDPKHWHYTFHSRTQGSDLGPPSISSS